MPRFSPAALLSFFENRLPPQASGALCVAYSGGLDSTVLLHAAARAVVSHPMYRLRAIHVDHQLHADSARWRQHCARTAQELRVELIESVLRVTRDQDSGLEAAARRARYDVFRTIMQPGETLLTAHHADDQLETVLLALMRGAGVRGLSAMPLMQPFSAGWLARPLLRFTRADLEHWARDERLHWLCDPSNEDTDYDRNYLRHRVLPVLRERWPALGRSAVRSAAHLGEAGALLSELAETDAAAVAVGRCLSAAGLEGLDAGRRRNVLRHWIRQQGARAPSSRKLAAIEHDMLRARQDRVPCIDWDRTQVRRHRGLLYCIVRQPPLPESTVLEWDPATQLELPAQLGRLRMTAGAPRGISAAKLAPLLQVRFRSGGESLRPAGAAHHRPLKKLLQESRVLPWWRARLPLIYSAGRLVSVGDLWIADEFAARAEEPAVSIVWEDKPTGVTAVT